MLDHKGLVLRISRYVFHEKPLDNLPILIFIGLLSMSVGPGHPVPAQGVKQYHNDWSDRYTHHVITFTVLFPINSPRIYVKCILSADSYSVQLHTAGPDSITLNPPICISRVASIGKVKGDI